MHHNAILAISNTAVSGLAYLSQHVGLTFLVFGVGLPIYHVSRSLSLHPESLDLSTVFHLSDGKFIR